MSVKAPKKEQLRKMVSIYDSHYKLKYVIYSDPFHMYYLYEIIDGNEVYTKRSAASPIELEEKYVKIK